MRRVCVFCGSRPGSSPAFREAAAALGQALARRGLGLVYGGAAQGLMGAVADAALDGGGEAIGVIPHGLARQEFAHPRLTQVHFVGSMHERKALMESLSDAFVALPGGFGTLDELFEALTWAQLGLHAKPIGLVDTEGYYAPLVAWIRGALDRGFVPRELEDALVVEKTPLALLDRLLAHRPPESPVKWLGEKPVRR
ncbi:MAG: TIGR00730 family Rossman fold protein [Myxococcota bacterium]